MKHLQPPTPAALYARVSSDRQDVDLSVSAQLRALKDYAKGNGYSVAREYVDEAESGRVADRPQFREMIEEGAQPNAPFEVILRLVGISHILATPSTLRPTASFSVITRRSSGTSSRSPMRCRPISRRPSPPLSATTTTGVTTWRWTT